MAIKKITQKSDDVTHNKVMEDVANLIEQLFKKIADMGKTLIVKYYPPNGQYSGNLTDHVLSTREPKELYLNSAWFGFLSGGIFYRTETTQSLKVFIAWVKSLLLHSDNFWKVTDKINCPQEVTFFTPLVTLGK